MTSYTYSDAFLAMAVREDLSRVVFRCQLALTELPLPERFMRAWNSGYSAIVMASTLNDYPVPAELADALVRLANVEAGNV